VVDGHTVEANHHPFSAVFLDDVEPHVVPDFLQPLPAGGVGIEDVLEEVLALDRDLLGAGLLARQDLLLEVGRVGVFEW